MKKLLLVVSIMLLGITLAACDQVQDILDEVAPTLVGVDDVTIEVGEPFNIMDGVSSFDDVDGDITTQITYTITDEIGNPATIDLTVPGVYIIKYTIEDNFGNTFTAERTLTIIEPSDQIVVHVQLTEAVAEARLNEFYSDVLGGGLTPQEICDIYIGNVPFPINNTTVEECLGGITEVRDTFNNFDILSVSLIQTDEVTDGTVLVPVYQAEVMLYQPNNETIQGMVDFAFLALEGNTASYIHFYGDPFLHDDGGNNEISLDTAREHLKMFYDSFFDVNYDVGDFCNDINFPFGDCTEIVGTARQVLTGYDEIYVQYSPITYPDGNQGDGFRADILINVNGQPVNFDVFFFFVTDPNTNEIVSLEFVSIPMYNFNMPPINFLEVPVDEATSLLAQLYLEIYDSTQTSSQFCNEYISMIPMEGPDYDGCLEAIDEMRNHTTGYLFADISSVQIDMDFGFVPGYKAIIEYTTNDGPLTVELEFVIVENSDMRFAMLLDHPLGYDDGPGFDLVDIGLDMAQARLAAFYDEMIDDNLDLLALCEGYVNGLPMDVSPEQCYQDLLPLREELQSYNILAIYEEFIDEGPIYSVDIELMLSTSMNQVYIKFGFVQVGDDTKLIIFNNPMGEFIQPFDTYLIPETDAYTLVHDLYMDMFSGTETPDQVCSMYKQYLPMDEPSLQECVDLVNYMRSELSTLTVNQVLQTTVDFDGFTVEGYVVTIEYTDNLGDSRMVDVPFVLVHSETDPHVMFAGHPLAQDGGPGMGFNLVIVPMDLAQGSIQGFYDGIIDQTVDLYTFCEAYMEGIFDTLSPSEIQKCADGLNNLRMGLASFTINGVTQVELNMDGLYGPGYEAYIQMVDFNNQQYDLTIIFGFIQIENGNKFMLFSNPGWGGDDHEVVSVDSPETALEQLINDIFTSTDVNNVCNAYLEQIPAFITFEECVAEFSSFKTNVQFMTLYSVVNYEIHDYGFNGPMYEITFDYSYYDGNLETRSIYVVYVQTDLGPKLMLLNNIAGDEIISHNIQPTDETGATTLLAQRYTDILSTTVTVEDFCNLYLLQDPFGPTYDECAEAISGMKADFTLFTITDVAAVNVRVGEFQYLPGFKAIVVLTGVDGDIEFDVEFLVTDNDNDNVLEAIFMSHPAGMENEGPNMHLPPISEVTLDLEAFYSELYDVNVLPENFCAEWILPNPMTLFDSTTCAEYVSTVRQDQAFVSVDLVTEAPIQTSDGSIPGYMATITFTHDGNVDTTMDLYVSYMYGEDGVIIFLLFTDQLVVGEPVGSMYFDTNPTDAANAINQFYTALLDPNVPEDVFCQVYLTLNTDMSIMDTQACMDLKVYYEGPHYTFTIGTPIFFEALGDIVPPYYQVEVTREYAGQTLTYTTSFIFLMDQNGQMLPSTPFDQTLGINDEPQINTYDMSEGQAYIEIDQFLADLTTGYDDEMFMATYFGLSPFDMTYFYEEIAFARFVGSVNQYIVTDVSLVSGSYLVTISETSEIGNNNLYATFSFVYDTENNSFIIVPEGPVLNGAYIPVETDVTVALPIITQYYSDLFDPAITNEVFCDTYYTNNPFDTVSLTDCSVGRSFSLARLETYTIQDITVETTDPYILFSALVSAEQDGFVLLYELSFAIVYQGVDMHLVLMDEVIVDVPLP